ncbi:MAG TPA: hypothetical protein VGD40_03325 [Chryseosolibacter sp.]
MKVRLAIAFILSGCVSNHQNFSVYKTKPFRSENKFSINGVYFLEKFSTTKYYDRPHAIFFYADGSISAYNTNQVSKIPESEFWTKPEEYLRSIDFARSPGEPGHFTVKNDTLVIEFITYRGGIPQRGSNRFEGILTEDSSIVLTQQICRWCHIRVEDFPDNGIKSLDNIRYRFYKTDIRPDSNKFWIKQARWYKRSVGAR